MKGFNDNQGDTAGDREASSLSSSETSTNGEISLLQLLGGIPFLRGLPPAALREFETRCRITSYAPDQTIIERDNDTRDVFFVLSGSARVINMMEERETSSADLRAGDHFGELSAIDCRERAARIVSTGMTIIAALPRDDFVTLLLEHPLIALKLLDSFADMIRANRRVHALSSLTAHQRICRELLRLVEPSPNGDGSWLIELAPNHQEIASWADTDKQEVASAIGALVRDGILERRNRSFLIKDRARLRRMAGE